MVQIEGRFWCGGVICEILRRISVIDLATHPFSLGMMARIQGLVINFFFAISAMTNYEVVDRAINQLQCGAVLKRAIFSHKNTSHQLCMYTHTQVHEQYRVNFSIPIAAAAENGGPSASGSHLG